MKGAYKIIYGCIECMHPRMMSTNMHKETTTFLPTRDSNSIFMLPHFVPYLMFKPKFIRGFIGTFFCVPWNPQIRKIEYIPTLVYFTCKNPYQGKLFTCLERALGLHSALHFTYIHRILDVALEIV